MYLKSLTLSDIAKIFIAFDRVVDCEENLKVFNKFICNTNICKK